MKTQVNQNLTNMNQKANTNNINKQKSMDSDLF
jgi:hypothetical protein